MYKRFMVFEWWDYDNPPPFECVAGSYENLNDAILKKIDIIDGGGFRVSIFDRIEGKIIS